MSGACIIYKSKRLFYSVPQNVTFLLKLITFIKNNNFRVKNLNFETIDSTRNEAYSTKIFPNCPNISLEDVTHSLSRK